MKPLIFLLIGATLSFYFWEQTKTPEAVQQPESIEANKPLEIAPQTSDPLPEPEDNKNRKIMLEIKKHFYAGAYEKTVSLIESARDLQDAKLQKWLDLQYPIALVSLGWLQIRLAKCPKAEKSFRKALEYQSLPEAHKGLAICAHKENNFAAAFEYLSRYLQQSPKDVQMQMLLADVQESRGNFPQAVRILESIKAKGEDKEALEKKLKAMRAKAKEQSHQGRLVSEHFQWQFRANEHDAIAQHFSVELESGLDKLIDRYGFKAPRRIIEINLYPSENFTELVNHSPSWADGIFDGRISIPVSDRMLSESGWSTLGRNLRHELIHALFFEMTSGRSLPSWFNEGIAQRLECENCGETRFPIIKAGMLKPETLSQSFIGFSPGKARIAYMQSLYLILTLERSEEDALYKVISGLTAYSSLESDQLLKKVGITFRSLHEKAEKNWMKQKKYSW